MMNVTNFKGKGRMIDVYNTCMCVVVRSLKKITTVIVGCEIFMFIISVS